MAANHEYLEGWLVGVVVRVEHPLGFCRELQGSELVIEFDTDALPMLCLGRSQPAFDYPRNVSP